MIPKVIHYFWFGGNPLPEKVKQCICSFKKFCPDYKIIQWDESNYDVTKNLYMKQAYDKKKWAFVSDYSRLDVIYTYGGIYLDTDVELIKNLDDLLKYSAFFGMEQGSQFVALGLGFGAEKHNPIIHNLLHEYDNLLFVKNGKVDLTTAPEINTRVFKRDGFKFSNEIVKFKDAVIFPYDYFCPLNFVTGKMAITNNTYSIHHYDSSWYTDVERYSYNLKKKLCKVLPKKSAGRLSFFIAQCKFKGIGIAVKNTTKKVINRK